MARCPDLNALAEVIGPRFAQVAAEHDPFVRQDHDQVAAGVRGNPMAQLDAHAVEREVQFLVECLRRRRHLLHRARRI